MLTMMDIQSVAIICVFFNWIVGGLSFFSELLAQRFSESTRHFVGGVIKTTPDTFENNDCSTCR